MLLTIRPQAGEKYIYGRIVLSGNQSGFKQKWNIMSLNINDNSTIYK